MTQRPTAAPDSPPPEAAKRATKREQLKFLAALGLTKPQIAAVLKMAEGEKRRTGRPTWQPTDEQRRQAEVLSGMGATKDEIAVVLGVSRPTVDKHLWMECARGRPAANVKVAESLYRMATNPDKPNAVACIFWLKAQAGWRDHAEQDALGKKEQRERDAATAHEGSDWGDLLRPNLRAVK